MPIKQISTAEPILGYELTSRIGSGGYGEVWSANAPGGLSKAIKFIYGFHDEDRAVRELKSLNRIKQVRHPFLISLERIEVVDGQLVIVTELADMSLKDRFDECRAGGDCGIPREELLKYIRDSADALDYISCSHSLQHLDIKPENLLLVGGHVKVADFGLVKDIHDATASLMGGLTPLYAPPELFDGRPSKFSDQYSLAIVYQEMLTGIRPFPGNTAAQLASQHLHGRPNVNPLPAYDRAAVAKALAKSPEERFPDCLALVDELSRSDRNSLQQSRCHVRPGSLGDIDENGPRGALQETERIVDSPIRAHEKSPTTNVVAPLRKSAPRVSHLPPLAFDTADAKLWPTLVVGIGETATATVRKLKQRIHDRLGDPSKIPAIRVLCLDTDRRNLLDATQGGDGGALDFDQTMELPLRKSEDYRADAKMHLSWLSRRWLYNIPRNLQTEGIRPLGRLAFVDHAARLLERLRELILQMNSEESIGASAAEVGMPPGAHRPRVFILASISGGVGSGMVLDVAYAVRKVLRDLSMSDDNIFGILTHSSRRAAERQNLSVANTYACLRELHHYSRSGNYPGDASCGLPAMQGEPFRQTYLLKHVDDGLPHSYGRMTDAFAEYLYLNSVSRCSAFFDGCRELAFSQPGSLSAHDSLRTFGLIEIGTASDVQPGNISYRLCRSLLAAWAGGAGTSTRKITGPSQTGDDTLKSDRHIAQKVEDLGLTVAALVERVSDLMKRDEHSDVLAQVDCAIRDVAGNPSTEQDAARNADAIQRIDESVSGPSKRKNPWIAIRDKLIPAIVRDIGKDLRSTVAQLVDEPSSRIPGAVSACERFSTALASAEASITETHGQLSGEISRLKREIVEFDASGRQGAKGRKKPDRGDTELNPLETRLRQYANVKLNHVAIVLAGHLAEQTREFVSSLGAEIAGWQRELNQLAESFKDLNGFADARQGANEVDPTSPQEKQFGILVSEAVNERLSQLSAQLDQDVQRELVSSVGGLRYVLAEKTEVRTNLRSLLLSFARGLVLTSIRHEVLARLSRDVEAAPEETSEFLRRCCGDAEPDLTQCGGAKRLLLALPTGQCPEELAGFAAQTFDGKVTASGDAGCGMIICHEVEGVPLANVAASLVEEHPDCPVYASRLKSRTDVNWSALTDRL